MNRTPPDPLVTSGFKGLAGEASQVELVAASSWSLQDTENWRNGTGGNGSTGRDHLMGHLFSCAISLALLKGSSKWP